MAHERTPLALVGEMEYFPDQGSPERTLLAAVLYRAFWDLNYISVDKATVREAIQWFRKKPKRRPRFLSYQNIKLTLDLPNPERIDRCVKEADEFLHAFRDKLPTYKQREKFARERGHYFSTVEGRSRYRGVS